MSDIKKVIIIGGVAGGASAAARLRRLSENIEIIVFERGEYISFANCGLPYHIGGIIQDHDDLILQSPDAMKKRFNIDVRINTNVFEIDRKNKEIQVRDNILNKIYTESYDKLIVSPGAKPIKPAISGIESEKVVTLRNITDMDNIIGKLKEKDSQSVAVIGGGYIGLEVIEALLEKKHYPVLVELSNQIMNAADPEMVSFIQQVLKEKGVRFFLKQGAVLYEEKGEKLVITTSEKEKIECDFAVLAIGVTPEKDLAINAGITIGELGGIAVNEEMKTNDQDIFAVGDVVEVEHFLDKSKNLIPLAGPANRQGRIAADNTVGRNSKYKKTQGTAICKVLDYTIAMTGLNEKQSVRKGLDYKKIYIHPFSHATYFPDAQRMSIKLLFESKTGRILGAQVVGQDGVDKRIDVFATAIRGRMTVFDLEELELSYAPPYGSAKDAVNMAGFVASNWLRGDIEIVHVEELAGKTEDQIILDVRTPEEIDWGAYPSALNIPVDELRERTVELDENKEYWITCHVGIRAYIAYRQLIQKGYKAKVMSGGYLTYQAFERII